MANVTVTVSSDGVNTAADTFALLQPILPHTQINAPANNAKFTNTATIVPMPVPAMSKAAIYPLPFNGRRRYRVAWQRRPAESDARGRRPVLLPV